MLDNWLLVVRDRDGSFTVSTHDTREGAEVAAALFREVAGFLALVIDLDGLVKELTTA